ncbi:hypothetical protein ACP70R_015205 [Stipagrostis hirtigluma subsp. patula]
MSFRAFRSLLTGRYWPRRALRVPAQAEPSSGIVFQPLRAFPAGRPAIGDASRGAVAIAALAGFAGLLCFRNYPDESSGETTDKKVSINRVTKSEPVQNQDMEAKGIQEQEATKSEPVQVDDMKATFEEWIKKVSREYEDEAEKAYRFEVFKKKHAELNPPNSGRPIRANIFTDWTKEEVWAMVKYGNGSISEEEYLEKVKDLPFITKPIESRREAERQRLRSSSSANLKSSSAN